MSIATFSYPATNLTFPSITLCKNNGYDIGEYLRAIYDNFQFACDDEEGCERTERLREDFPAFASNGADNELANIFRRLN